MSDFFDKLVNTPSRLWYETYLKQEDLSNPQLQSVIEAAKNNRYNKFIALGYSPTDATDLEEYGLTINQLAIA